jgi:CxxC-x17-CxxC domain-containing protein
MPQDNSKEITVVGQTNFRGIKRAFGIYPDDRRRHLYVIGKTGVGKSTLLENMIAQDIASGKGVGLVDPHGDTAERLLDSIPPWRVNDVVYFDPSDVEYPIAFNVLEAIDPNYKYLVASGLVSSLKKIWADSWGPRLEYILRNTILALLDYPSSTMLGIMRMLSDKNYRKKVISAINDPVIKAFWVNEFSNYNEKFRSEAISPIQNKVGQFLSSAIIRNIVAQPKSTIDMADIMDNGKILLINVSKGKIGEDNSALLGAMLITKIQLAAMDRAKIPEEERRDFYLYVDEFQNFATESFASILSEARKYRLNLTIAHQYITQMEEVVRDAVFGNVGTMVSFRVGAFDAEFLEKEFAPVFTETDLVNLAKYTAYIKLMINGITSKPFSMQTIPPAHQKFGRAEIVRKVSRERYGRKREVVEDKIARWSGVAFKGAAEEEGRIGAQAEERERRPALPPVREEQLADVVLAPPNEPIRDLASVLKSEQAVRSRTDRPKKDRQTWRITCAECGKEADVPFEPVPGKPAYCRDCFERIKQERRQPKPKDQAPVSSPPPQSAPSFRGPPPPPAPRRS